VQEFVGRRLLLLQPLPITQKINDIFDTPSRTSRHLECYYNLQVKLKVRQNW
jgi:hypothetical protein